MNSESFNNFKMNCIYAKGLSDTEAYILFQEYNKKDLIKELSSTDYEAIKYSEGWFTEEEYEPIKQQRENLRKQIRNIEKEINDLQDKSQ